jgi:membrane associated rhomboid family serine protease
MGIYDREYYRGETQGSAWFATSQVCKTIIIANIVVFLVEHLGDPNGQAFIQRWFAAHSDDILHRGYVWQLLTATFLHATPMHLIVNMYVLWLAGREMESMYGHRDFLALYLSAAALSTLAWAVLEAAAGRQDVMIGASGAVYAVVVLFTLYFPRRELLFMFVVPVEVWLLVTLYVAFDVYTLLSGSPTRTAVEAHIAGAAYGFLFKQLDLRWSRLPGLRGRRPRLRIVPAEPPREKPSARPSPSVTPSWSSNPASAAKPATAAVVSEEQLDARLDEILAKIAREGRGSLTEEENRILQEASRRARNRRSDRL